MKILCPTDFSKHSLKAVEYAVSIANAVNAELHVVSAFDVPRKSSSFINIDDTIRANTEEDMEQFIAGVSPLLTVEHALESHVYQGDTINVINGYVKDRDIDLIIMGTQGSNSMRTLLFGSTTKKVASKARVPVLAIPENAIHNVHNNKMLLALDNKLVDNEALFEIPKKLAKYLGLDIDILHIKEDDSEKLPFDPYISEYLGDALGEVNIIEGNNPVNAIKSYAESHPIGMVLMIRRKKGFFERLFTVGNTSQEIAKTNIPLLILPD